MSEKQGMLLRSGNRGQPATQVSPTARSSTIFRTVGSGIKGILGLQQAGSTSSDGKANFTSSIGAVLSMIGTTVGTGNIWRFPRIMATNAEEGGALVFILVWLLFLFIWSIPLNLIQYGVGRYTKLCTVESFARLIGPSYRWLGGFIVGVNLFIGAFYSVLLGYCGYYAFFFMATSLPDSLETAESHFDDLIKSNWPVFFHIFFTLIASLAVLRGVSTIEPVNRIMVPTLLIIVVFTLYWSLYLPYAGMGLIHMFTPTWKSFGNTQIWRDALTQNAWDTAAGGGLFLTYATYMTRYQGAVKLGVTIPMINNCISLMSGMTVFCNVFSYEYLKGSSIEEIIDVLKTNGPFNTGITFIQMPLLYGSVNGGRVLAVLFFIGVSLAGLSSLISILEQSVHILEDYGIKRIPGAIVICFVSGSMGLVSALSNDVFVNQDAAWAQALILCGCLFLFLVIRYGILKFRRELYNDFGIGDWRLPLVWVFLILFICPIEGVGMLLWWIIDEIVNNSDPYYPNQPWWEFTPTSLITIVTQWIILLCIVVGLNWWMTPIAKIEISKYEPVEKSRYTKFRNSLIKFFLISKKPPLKEVSPPSAGLIEDTSSSEDSCGSMDAVEIKESSLIYHKDDPPDLPAIDSDALNSSDDTLLPIEGNSANDDL